MVCLAQTDLYCLLALVGEFSSYKVDNYGRVGMIISAFCIDFCVWYVIPIKFCLKSLTSKWFSYILVTAKSVFSKSNYFLTFRVADTTLCSFLYCFWLFRHFEEEMLNRLHLRLSVFFAKQICVSETSIFHHYLLLLQSFAAYWIKLVANTLSDGFIDVQF